MTNSCNPEGTTAVNSTIAIGGVSCLADTFMQGGNPVLKMKLSALIPWHHKLPNRYKQLSWK